MDPLFAQLATAAATLLDHPACDACCLEMDRHHRPEPLIALPHVPTIRAEDLERMGCGRDATTKLLSVLDRCRATLANTHQRIFVEEAVKLGALFSSAEEEQYLRMVDAFRVAVVRSFSTGVEAASRILLDEVRAAQLRHSTSPPPAQTAPESPANGRPKQFTAEVLAILEAAFEASDSVSRGERRELANVTGLTERQVLTWVRTTTGTLPSEKGADAARAEQFANQRQRRNKKKQQPPRVPGTPYARPDAVPSTSPSRMRAPSQQQRRTVSGSSFGSSGSSLVEYAEQDLPLPPLDPSIQQPLFLHDDVSSMDATEPTPRAASFSFATPSSTFDCSTSTCSSLDELAPHPPRATYDPASLFTTSPSNASTGSFEVPQLGAPFEPTLITAPAPTDAWMDDEFYRNLFGTLGLDAGEGAGMEAEGGGEGGGLTLSLDAVRAELEGMQGIEADLSFLF